MSNIVERSGGMLTLDTERQVFFYEQDFYVLSNFSSFRVVIETPNVGAIDFDTAEHAYHWHKFPGEAGLHLRGVIRRARSAHDAFKFAEANRADRRPDWDEVKVDIMRGICPLLNVDKLNSITVRNLP